MPSKILCLLWLAATFNAPLALAQDRIRISIKNDYNASVDFGVLGKVLREGTDTADGVLEFQAGKYTGVVEAWVSSTQTVTGLGGVGSCGPGTYRNSQQLQVVGRSVSDFNPAVQAVTFNPATGTKYLSLEFVPVAGAELQPPNPNPDQDQVIDCHTVIETEAGRFLPLNDTRWTMEGGGYIIALPSSGALNYTDETVPAAGGAQLGPFNAKKSVWTITVERLP
jgi:hypothetical protein